MSSIGPDSTVKNDCASSDADLALRYENLALSDIASSADVSSVVSFPVYDVNTSIDIKKLKSHLAELIKTKGPDLIQACKNYDRRSTYKIAKSQLKQVIRMFCLPITSAQFDCLLDELKITTDEKINYHDFFSKLSSKKIPKTANTLSKIPNNLSLDEVELMIKEKIKNNLRNVIRSFWLFDVNKDGFIQKAELRRIIRNYCFKLSDDVYDDLWKTYDPKMTGLVSYKDFLIRLGINAERYKKYMPSQNVASSLCWKENKKSDKMFDRSWEPKCRRAALENRDDPAVQGLPLEEVIIIFTERIQRQSGILRDVFKVFDSKRNGKVSLSDFRGVINFFLLAMSTRLFNLVMKKLNIDVSADTLDYERFLEDFCQIDLQTSSERKYENLDVCAPVVQRIRNIVLNPEARLCSVFTKFNTDELWQITRPELKKAIELGLNFKLTDEDFKDLTTILDPENTNIIKCADFIHLFENSRNKDCIEREEIDTELRKESDAEKYSHLKGTKLQSRLKHHLNKNINNIEKAILVCDSDQSGFILPEKLKEILSTFCFPLSDEQFEDVISNVKKYRDTLNYHEFLTSFKKSPNEDTEKWISVIDKLVNFKSKCPPEMLVNEVEELIRDGVRSRKTAMLKDFKTLDICNVGIVSKEDFRNVLSKFVCRLTDKQFEALWETFPRNQYNQLLYDEFLEQYTSPLEKSNNSETGAMQSSVQKDVDINDHEKASPQKSVQTSSAERNKSLIKKSTVKRKTAKEIFYSQAPHLQSLFQSMEPTIIRNFRNIRYHLRRADPKCTDMVDFVTFKDILAEHADILISSEDEFNILEHFDTRLTGKINYREFLRIFVWYA